MAIPNKTEKNGLKSPTRDARGRWVRGNPGSPGRPKGKTIKEMVREYLDEHPGELKKFVEHFVKSNRELAWQMLEGRPQQDVTSGGEKIEPTPIYAGLSVISVPRYDSDQKGIQPSQED